VDLAHQIRRLIDVALVVLVIDIEVEASDVVLELAGCRSGDQVV
jgi:hypothetical protein